MTAFFQDGDFSCWYYSFELFLELARSTIFPDFPSRTFHDVLRMLCDNPYKTWERHLSHLAAVAIAEIRNNGYAKYITIKNIEWHGYFLFSFTTRICHTLFSCLFKADSTHDICMTTLANVISYVFIWSIYITYTASIRYSSKFMMVIFVKKIF